MKKKILIIDNDLDMCTLLSRFLTKNGYETDTANSGNKGIEKFKEKKFDIVLCDYRLGDKEGKEVLTEIKAISPHATVLIITGYSDIKTAVDVIKLGAYDYITKPLIPDEVLKVLDTALHQTKSDKTASKSDATLIISSSSKSKKNNSTYNTEFLIGKSPNTKELYNQIAIVAPTNYSIILYGESGTGKEIIAKTIHEMSDRKNKPFIAMDCGTLSKELAGSELFGHVKGSFTGALNDKDGHFELANGGTLFLDEVANLSYEIQATLLRVIQERKFKKVGGTKEIPLDIRIIVASNENLQEAYRQGKFREDLYHRFNEFSITLPPLRNRKQDIPLFAEFFLNQTNIELNKEAEGFEDEVMQMFINYAWPGNLRELKNVVRRSVLLTNNGKITAKTLPAEITNSNPLTYHTSLNDNSTIGLDLKNTATKAEYEAIMNVLKEVNYNKTKAAEILKIDRKTLYNKIRAMKNATPNNS